MSVTPPAGETRYVDQADAEVRATPASASGNGVGNGLPLVIRGIVVRYGTLSTTFVDDKKRKFREKFAPGAFSRSLGAGADVRALVNHNRDLVLGRNKSGTLTIRDEPAALYFELRPSDSVIADHYAKAVERGDIDGMSFRFYTAKERWTGQGDGLTREILEADIDEISIATFPAYRDSYALVETDGPSSRSLDEYLTEAETRAAVDLENLRRSRSAAVRLRLAESEVL